MSSSSSQPSCETNDLGQCNFCPSYHFRSKTGKNRHMSVFHRRQRTQTNPKNFICDICQTIYSSLSSINRYKKEKEAYQQTGRRKTENTEWKPTKVKEKQTKPWTINDMLRANKTVNQTIENQQEDDECSAQNCTINENYWVECERCSSWFHVYCVTKYEEPLELDGYACEICV